MVVRRPGGREPRGAAVALADAVHRRDRAEPPLHDWQGSYGLRPFLPWNPTWYYADWVAVVDPFFWLLPLIALAWGAERHWIRSWGC